MAQILTSQIIGPPEFDLVSLRIHDDNGPGRNPEPDPIPPLPDPQPEPEPVPAWRGGLPIGLPIGGGGGMAGRKRLTWAIGTILLSPPLNQSFHRKEVVDG